MAQLGSYALLFALALSGYSFVAGLVALMRPGSERMGETARRAGIAVCACVFLASLVLVVSAFQDDFSIAYILHHSNHDLPAPYKFATLWSGQEGSLLFWSLLLGAYGLVLRLRHKTDPRLFAYASVVIAAVQVFFLLLLNFAAHPFATVQGTIPANGDGLPAFRNDAGEAGHAEDVEHVAGLRHVLACDPWYFPDAQRDYQFRACLRAIGDWQLVCLVPGS